MEFGVPIKVSHNSSRGYYLLVPTALDPLPPGFTQAVLNKKTIGAAISKLFMIYVPTIVMISFSYAACSTEEFNSLSDRATEAITSALAITHELIQSLLAQIRESISCLFTFTDSLVALASS